VGVDPDLKRLVDRLATVERPSPEAFEVCEEIMARWRDSEDAASNDAVLMALSVKAHMLRRAGRLEESVEAYDQVLHRIEQRGGPPRRLEHALYTKGQDLVDLGRHAEAVEVYDTFLERFGEHPSAGRLHLVIEGRYIRACSLADLGRVDEALAEFDAITARYIGEEDPRARGAVANCLGWKAKVLDDRGRCEEAVHAYDQLVALLSDADDADLRFLLIWAFLWKGTLLQKLDRTAEARDLYGQAFEAFPRPERPDIDELVSRVRRRLIGLGGGHPAAVQDATESPASLDDTRAVVARLEELVRMAHDGQPVEAAHEATELARALQTAPAAESLVVRARIAQAVTLFASDQGDQATSTLRGIVSSHRHSSDPELRQLAAVAQHNLANILVCSDQPDAGEQAMGELVGEFGEFAADALQQEAAERAKLLGVSLTAEEAGGLAIVMARVLVRCAPQRVAEVADPALAKLRSEARSPMRDELIAQLEQLRAQASEAKIEALLNE
jgi:tetratricopeptide (TPR) repeat protein